MYMENYTLLIKLACRILLFNLGEQILQTESRQILFGTFKPFQIDMNSNLYKRICLCGQLSLLSGSRGEQHSLKVNIEVSFTFSESVILVGHATLIFHGKKQHLFWEISFGVVWTHKVKKHFLYLETSSFERVLRKKLTLVGFLESVCGIIHFCFIEFGLDCK